MNSQFPSSNPFRRKPAAVPEAPPSVSIEEKAAPIYHDSIKTGTQLIDNI